MDLVYVPEVLTYGLFRNHQYRDYEQPWNNNYFNDGRSAQNHCQRLPQHHEQKLLSKENCHLCRESKRRSLAAYIRGKSRRNSCHEIHEEEEEQETATVRGENAKVEDQHLSEDQNESSKVSNKSKETKEN